MGVGMVVVVGDTARVQQALRDFSLPHFADQAPKRGHAVCLERGPFAEPALRHAVWLLLTWHSTLRRFGAARCQARRE